MQAQIAVTTTKNGDKVSEHAGHAVYFKFYIIDQEKGVIDEKLIKVDKKHTLHNLLHTPDINPDEHEVLKSQILLTGGIGMGAINKLAHLGVRAYIIEESNPDNAIKQLINGTLKAVDPSTFQHNHHHEHNHDEHDCNGHHH